ncbi:MAG: hypothetical protein ACYDGS_09070 [Thermoleophilia bacterium]
MSELLAKLTNLSYEILGVILPGIVGSLFLLLWWEALGTLAPLWTVNVIPELDINKIRPFMESLNFLGEISIIIAALLIWYFLGQMLLWSARSGKSKIDGEKKLNRKDAAKRGFKRLFLSLIFRIPKPSRSFDSELQPLFDVVQNDFAGKIELDWRQFYPVIKSYLRENLSHSLLATYQTKYTFHRSIVTASACLFWVSFLSEIAALITFKINGREPEWVLLTILGAGALIFVWNFSSSYMYNWKLFGNTIVTESYAFLHGPKND